MSIPSGSVDSILDASLGIQRIRQANQKVSRKAQWSMFVGALLLNDTLMTLLAFGLAFWARFYTRLPIFEEEVTRSITYYRTLAVVLIPLWLAVFHAYGLYRRQNLLGGTGEYARLFRASSNSILVVIVVGFLDPTLILARGWLLLAWILSFLLAGAGRFWLRRCVYLLRRQGYFVSNTVIVGANPEGYSLAEQLLLWEKSGLYVLGFVDDALNTGVRAYRRLFNLGHLNQIDTLIEHHDIEEIILVSSALPREEIVAIYKKYGSQPNLNLRISSGLFEVVTTNVEIWETLNVPLVRIKEMRVTGTDRAFKFALDFAVTVPVLLFFSPLLLLIAILIKLDSPGPVIHRRRVMGRNGEQFEAYKFRTMHVNGDEILDQHPLLKAELARNHKLKDDPRVTKVGAFLRKYSLDEVPQLLNVLRRQMSVVGPRMIAPDEMAMYSQWDMNLLTVNPGLTGLWQVSGRSDTTYAERVRLDMEYIRTWTIWSDLYILRLTIPAVIKRRGAY